MKISKIITSVFVLFCVFANAQHASKYNFYAGGGLGLQFGTITLIDISPHAAYQVNKNLSAGLGVSYQYYKDKRFQQSFSTDVYGGRIFIRHDIYNNVFVDAEYEVLSYDSYDWNSNNTKRITAHNYLFGGGYRQKLGERSFVNLLLLWNLNEDNYSLFHSPISRVEINFMF